MGERGKVMERDGEGALSVLTCKFVVTVSLRRLSRGLSEAGRSLPLTPS